jgi:hypothetical protein
MRLIPVILLSLILLLPSCKKRYTCTCTRNASGEQIYYETYKEVNWMEAANHCLLNPDGERKYDTTINCLVAEF